MTYSQNTLVRYKKLTLSNKPFPELYFYTPHEIVNSEDFKSCCGSTRGFRNSPKQERVLVNLSCTSFKNRFSCSSR